MSTALHHFDMAARAAQHCPELIRRSASEVDLAARWQALGEQLAEMLPSQLAPLLAGVAPAVEVAGGSAPAGLCAQGLVRLNGTPGPLHLAIDGAAMLRLVDLAFGGRGEVPCPLPQKLPPSANILVRQVEEAVIATLAGALARPLEALTIAASEPAKGKARSADPATLGLVLTVREDNAPAWTVALSATPETVAAWLDDSLRPAAPRAADPAAAPFADLPLPLTATLVDIRLPLSTIAALEPGMVLPVAVARAVPLAVAGTIIARGSVGAQDDRIAIKLTQIA